MGRRIVGPSRIFPFLTPCIAYFGILLAGCGTVDLEIRRGYTNSNMQPRSVAILPFTLEEPGPEEVSPHELFRTCFYNYFSYLGYVDLPLKTVDQKLSRAGLTDSNKILELSPEKLRRILGVDAVIRGRVLAANNFTGGIHAETSIHAKIDMLDLRTGDILWETEHTEMIYSGILSPTIVDIIRDQMENVKVHQAYFKTAEIFSVNMMKEIPDPADSWNEEIRLPEITYIETNLKPNLKLKPNDRIYVRGFGIAKMIWRIYNRWGVLVYVGTYKDEGWDGTYKGVLQPQEVYHYTLLVEFADGTKATKKGDITLLR